MTPTLESHFLSLFAVNSLPLSLRIYSGQPLIIISPDNTSIISLFLQLRLLKDWSWGEATESSIATQSTPIHHLKQVIIQREKPIKQSVLDNLSREEYLNNLNVKDFIRWLESQLDTPGGFEHQYYLVKAKRQWRCSCLYEAYENYWWSYNMVCPIQEKKVLGTGNRDSFKYMNLLAEVFRSSVLGNDVDLVRKSALAMLTWGGGVQHINRERIEGMGDGVCDYFRQVKKV
jgi:hypothetical protein